MKYNAGFIGVGNMGGALVDAVCNNGTVALFDIDQSKAIEKSKTSGAINTTLENIASNSKYLFLGVKPNIIEKVAADIRTLITDETVIISMAAGTSVSKITAACGTSRVIRIMPNTPVSAASGMILYCCGEAVTDSDIDGFVSLLSNAGELDMIDEKLIDAASALSGCGPAFVYMFIDALADGAVKCGLPRDKALVYAKQTVFGSAAMSKNTDKHLGKLKDEVCSPGPFRVHFVLFFQLFWPRSPALPFVAFHILLIIVCRNVIPIPH